MLFTSFIGLLVLQRVIELMIARRNERQMKKNGAIEFGTEHYPWMVLMHSGFFTILILEVVTLNGNYLLFGCYGLVYLYWHRWEECGSSIH